MMNRRRVLCCTIFTVILLAEFAVARVVPAGSAFTYQGQLKQGGDPVSATADFQFRLFDVDSGGSPLGAMFPADNVTVSEGQFTVDIDFGALAFNGDARWLDISVRSPAGSGVFTPLTPRQPVRPVPMSQFAMGGSGAFTGSFSGDVSGNGANLTGIDAAAMTGVVPSAALSGTYSGAVTFSNAGNSFQGAFAGAHSGNGSALISLNASNITTGTLTESRMPSSLLDRIAGAVASATEIVSVSVNSTSVPGIAVAGNRAFIVGSSGLRIFDISNPASPLLQGTAASANGKSVAVAGNFAYVVTTGSPGQLKIVDATNSSSPVLVGTTNTNTNPAQIAVAGTRAYVVTTGGAPTLQIFNVSNPSSPTLLGSVNTGGGAGVDVAGSFAYVVNVSGSLQIYNVNNPASPNLVGSISTASTAATAIDVVSNKAYVATIGPTGLQVFDVTSAASPTLLGSVNGLSAAANSVHVDGDYAYLAGADRLQVVNINDPAAMFLATSVGFPGVVSVAHSGDYAFAVSDALFKVFAPSALENSAFPVAIFGGGTLVVDSVNGHVGIGGGAPIQALDVGGPSGPAATSGSGSNGIMRVRPSATSAVLDIGGTGSPAHAWLQSRDSDNYALNYNLVLNPNGGNVGIGTTTPGSALDVNGGLRVAGVEGAYVGDGSTARTWIGAAANANFIQSGNTAWTESRLLYFTGFNTNPGTFAFIGDVGIGDITPDALLDVEQSNSTVAIFNRTSSDGVIVNFQQNGASEGTISVSGATVSYNAFTGSHYGWTDQQIERFALVRMTGDNRRCRDESDSEIIYGIEPSARANDPAIIGAYLGLQESTQPRGLENPDLIMSVGNGEIWVTSGTPGIPGTPGAEIKPGDLLISSDTPGCAMLDDPRRFAQGHIVARAAEPVRWDAIHADEDGVRRARISVLFDRFTRGSDAFSATGLADRMDRLQQENSKIRAEKDAENAELKSRIQTLESMVQQMLANHKELKP